LDYAGFVVLTMEFAVKRKLGRSVLDRKRLAANQQEVATSQIFIYSPPALPMGFIGLLAPKSFN
jgi:hypothetical protein